MLIIRFSHKKLSHTWKSNFKQQLGCRFDILDNESYFLCYDICNYIRLDTSAIFRFYLLKYSLLFKYSCTNIFHRRSLYTFHFTGLRSNDLKWFTRYLSNPRKYVTYDRTHSTMNGINCGVPQGSILRLFIYICMNDLCSICKFTTLILFVDDANLFCIGPYIK